MTVRLTSGISSSYLPTISDSKTRLIMDWATWEPNMRATLLFLQRGDEVLLIRKKRGLGAGKINGPGGRLEDGESPVQCIIREVKEELSITVVNPVARGILRFQFSDGLALYCTVFTAHEYHGTPIETDEAIPLWIKTNAIPYHEMWEDDQYWLPGLLEGKSFESWFQFNGDKMLSHRVVWV